MIDGITCPSRQFVVPDILDLLQQRGQSGDPQSWVLAKGIQIDETHSFYTVRFCVDTFSVAAYAATRERRVTTSAHCISARNQTAMDWLRRSYSLVVAFASLVGVA
jgi:hypothetical protein